MHTLVFTAFAQNYTISGYVKDSQTGEIIIGANIYEKNTSKATTTNSYGYYNINLPANDSLFINVSFTGYKEDTKKIILNKNQQINFFLNTNNEIETVTVNGKINTNKTTGSTVEIPISIAKLIPSIGGETDLIKSLQLMPGIQSAGEGSSQLIVRGGSPDQNLILLDDVPLYYANHLGGFISAFNPYSIKKIKIIKGGFPAQYGGRLSSIIDIRTKDGNMKKTAGEYSIGVLSAKLSLEAPIKKDKMSFIFSGRKGLLDLYSMIFLKINPNTKENAGYNFYDYNLKFNYIVSDKSRLYFGNYSSSDAIYIYFKQNKDGLKKANSFETGWRNTVSNVKWNYIFSDKMFANFIFAHSYYNYHNSIYNSYQSLSDTVSDYIDESGKSKYSSNINDFIVKADFNYNLNYYNNFKFGLNILPHVFRPGVSEFNYVLYEETVLDTMFKNNNINTFETAFYLSNTFKIRDRVNGNIGIYNAVYFTSHTKYFSFEPRVMLSYDLSQNAVLKTSFVKMGQFVHLLSTAGIGTPADFWVPTTDRIPPQESYQYTFGTDIYLRKKTIFLNFEVFYKKLNNLIELKEGETLLWTTTDWQNTVDINGTGKIYGLEILAQKKTGKLTGWISYTLSKNTRQFENQNLGNTYPYIYDRTHNFSATAIYKIKNINLSASWVYLTGNAVTLAYGKHETINFNNEFPESHNSGYNNYYFNEVYMFTEKNNFRMPATHHLSIGINLEKQRKRGKQILSFNIYNVYNRKNPYMLFYQRTNSDKLVLNKMTLFPIIPSISYSFKF